MFLHRRHPFEPGNRRHHLQEQVELGVLDDLRLHEDRAVVGVEADRDPVRDIVERVVDERARVGVRADVSACQSATK